MPEFKTEPNTSIDKAQAPINSVMLGGGATERWYLHQTGRIAYSSTHFRDYCELSTSQTLKILRYFSALPVRNIFTTFLTENNFLRGEPSISKIHVLVFEYLLNKNHANCVLNLPFKIKFIGDLEKYFTTPEIETILQIEAISATKNHPQNLFIGLPFPSTGVDAKLMSQIRLSHMSSPKELLSAYYQDEVQHLDFFIGGNSLTVSGLLPPLLQPKYLYFLQFPTLSLEMTELKAIFSDYLSKTEKPSNHQYTTESRIKIRKLFYQSKKIVGISTITKEGFIHNQL